MDGIEFFGTGFPLAPAGQSRKAPAVSPGENGFASHLDQAVAEQRKSENAHAPSSPGIAESNLTELRARFDEQTIQAPAHVIERAKSLVNDAGQVIVEHFQG